MSNPGLTSQDDDEDFKVRVSSARPNTRSLNGSTPNEGVTSYFEDSVPASGEVGNMSKSAVEHAGIPTTVFAGWHIIFYESSVDTEKPSFPHPNFSDAITATWCSRRSKAVST
jgi:hypothetical protein